MSLPIHSLAPPLDVTQPVEPPDNPGQRVRITVTRKTTDPAAGLVAIAGVLLVIGFASVAMLSRSQGTAARTDAPPSPTPPPAAASTPVQPAYYQAKQSWMPTPGMPAGRFPSSLGRQFAGAGPAPQLQFVPPANTARITAQPQIEVQAVSGASLGQSQGASATAVTSSTAGSGQVEVRNLSMTRMYVELHGGGSTATVSVEPGGVGKANLPAGSYVATVASLDPTVTPYRFQQVVEAGRTHSIPLLMQTSRPTRQTGVSSTTGAGTGTGDAPTDSTGQSGVSTKPDH